MNQLKKTYYYDLSQNEIEKIKQLEVKPKLLLHACCVICSSVPLEQLTPYFEVTIFFNNSNIYPYEEYQHRLYGLQRFIKLKYPKVEVIVEPYDYDNYIKELEILKDCPEGGKRCKICYKKRMELAYKFANDNDFDYFTTVMTISRQKNSFVINQIGNDLSIKYPKVKYFYSDFKKHKGQDRSIEIKNEYGLYQQNYCGCEYSIKQ